MIDFFNSIPDHVAMTIMVIFLVILITAARFSAHKRILAIPVIIEICISNALNTEGQSLAAFIFHYSLICGCFAALVRLLSDQVAAKIISLIYLLLCAFHMLLLFELLFDIKSKATDYLFMSHAAVNYLANAAIVLAVIFSGFLKNVRFNLSNIHFRDAFLGFRSGRQLFIFKKKS